MKSIFFLTLSYQIRYIVRMFLHIVKFAGYTSSDIIVPSDTNYLRQEESYYINYSQYRQFSNIRRTQSPNINVSRLVLQLSLPNPLKPGVKLRMKM